MFKMHIIQYRMMIEWFLNNDSWCMSWTGGGKWKREIRKRRRSTDIESNSMSFVSSFDCIIVTFWYFLSHYWFSSLFDEFQLFSLVLLSCLCWTVGPTNKGGNGGGVPPGQNYWNATVEFVWYQLRGGERNGNMRSKRAIPIIHIIKQRTDQ